MLEEILAHLRNYFVKTAVKGFFEIKDGVIIPTVVSQGQHFRIVGSAFNDGVYEDARELKNEAFLGEIWLLAIPSALLTLVQEIETYSESASAASSPYVSESYFDDYRYTKATDANGVPISAWQDVFSKKLNQWRKL